VGLRSFQVRNPLRLPEQPDAMCVAVAGHRVSPSHSAIHRVTITSALAAAGSRITWGALWRFLALKAPPRGGSLDLFDSEVARCVPLSVPHCDGPFSALYAHGKPSDPTV
jgi:hypothetical protein